MITLDCDGCAVRGPACSDCVVSVLLGVPEQEPMLTMQERTALQIFADHGMLPPLRMVSDRAVS
ncbi:MAG: hypothetical protein ACRDAX_03790 [Propionibacteriaceae bacterium]